METLPSTLWLAISSLACLLLLWLLWRQAYPHCATCRKHIRRAFLHCPWCGLQQYHVRHVPQKRTHRQTSRGALVAQEADAMPHKRTRTVILPEHSQTQTQQGYDDYDDTVLVPEQAVHVRVRTCGRCHAEQREKSKVCWKCGSKILFWMERRL